MIRFICSGCQGKLTAKDKLAGQLRKCPQCGKEVHIPNAADSPDIAANTPTDDLLDDPSVTPSEATGPSVLVDAIQEGLPQPAGSRRLNRTSRYLICDRTKIFAIWSGNGWKLKTGTGLVSASRNPQLLPAEGNFTLVELSTTRDDTGVRLSGIHCDKLVTRWALKPLEQDADDKIFSKVQGPGSLTREQKVVVARFVKEQFMPEVWENSESVHDFLVNTDYTSAGTS